ncbi:bifunctional pyr operon transcriptional regulator/uracil phosphoribosyltransferase PyrR, partial [Burkholderia pseudomallei]
DADATLVLERADAGRFTLRTEARAG